jgi:hypothetical protein
MRSWNGRRAAVVRRYVEPLVEERPYSAGTHSDPAAIRAQLIRAGVLIEGTPPNGTPPRPTDEVEETLGVKVLRMTGSKAEREALSSPDAARRDRTTDASERVEGEALAAFGSRRR